MPTLNLGSVIGRQGEPGRDGVDGAKGDKGTSYHPCGEWIANTQYLNTDAQIDVVTYNGGAFYCKETHSSPTPPTDDSAHWGIVCSGITRYVCNFHAQPGDWIADNTIAPFVYKQVITFSPNAIPANVYVGFYVSDSIDKKYGIALGAITGTNGIVLYAETVDINMPAIDGAVYYELSNVETINV